MSEGAWSVAVAKAKFSEVIDKARTQGPQTVTRNGKRAVVVVSAEEWDRRTKPKESLVEFLRKSPLRGSGIDLERIRDRPRDVEL